MTTSNESRMSQEVNNLNLKVLRHHDPSVVEILDNSGFTAAYSWDRSTHSWSQQEIQGCLFLVRRSKEPWFYIIILNRNSPRNLVEAITPEFKVQHAEPYLLYCNRERNVRGIWFFDGASRQRVVFLLQKIITSLGAPTSGLQSSQDRVSQFGDFFRSGSVINTNATASHAVQDLLTPEVLSRFVASLSQNPSFIYIIAKELGRFLESERYESGSIGDTAIDKMSKSFQ